MNGTLISYYRATAYIIIGILPGRSHLRLCLFMDGTVSEIGTQYTVASATVRVCT
jgi:hypothetical protein